MKRIILFSLLLSMAIPEAKSQDFEFTLNQGRNSDTWNKKIQEAGIKSTKMTKVYPAKKNRQFLQYKYEYDRNGKLTESKTFNRRNKIIELDSYRHDSKNNLTSFIVYRRNGKILRKFTYEYNDSGYVTRQNFYWKSADKLESYTIKKYDARNKILEFIYYYPVKKEAKIHTRYEYSYYPDGSKKQTIEYNARGKIEHEWNYECNPEGSIDPKKLKDTSKVCIRYETDKDGNKITIKEEFVKSGRTARIISRYNSKGYMIGYTSYDRNNHERYGNKYEYDKNGNMTQLQFFRKGKLAHRYVYECDANGFMARSYTYTKSDKPDFIMNFEYEHY